MNSKASHFFWRRGGNKETLIRLYRDGYSASMIGVALKLSRMAIVGKTARLQAAGELEVRETRPTITKPNPQHMRRGGRKYRQKTVAEGRKSRAGIPNPYRTLPKPRIIPSAPATPPTTFLARTKTQCGFPIGVDAPGPMMAVCGAPKPVEVPYCEYHTDLAASMPGRPWTPQHQQKWMQSTGFGSIRLTE